MLKKKIYRKQKAKDFFETQIKYEHLASYKKWNKYYHNIYITGSKKS